MRFQMILIGVFMLAGVALRAAEPAATSYVGSSSCAAFGCHGNTARRTPVAWKSAFVVWAQQDPHQNAYHVLFSKRSAEIVALLMPSEQSTAKSKSTPPHEMNESDYEANYRVVIEQQCVGCHATQPAMPASQGDTNQALVDTVQNGVSCESCHGPAKEWLAEHATSRWATYSAAEKAARWGLKNTQDMGGRAGICMDCHVGPFQSSAGKTFQVTHELIAAGHPRLSFEFSAYLANLPPHWDESKDKQRHRQRHGGRAGFHFDAWRVGQIQMARKLASQLAEVGSALDEKPRISTWPEFASFDCFACHHRLQADRALTVNRAGAFFSLRVRGQPQPGDWPFAHLHAIIRESRADTWRQLEMDLTEARQHFVFASESPALRQQSFRRFASSLAKASESLLNETTAREGCVAILDAMLMDLSAQQSLNWDRVSQFHLALVAFVEDHEPLEKKSSKLARLVNTLGVYLGSRFPEPQTATIYDSPAEFQASDADLAAQLRAIAAELRSLRKR